MYSTLLKKAAATLLAATCIATPVLQTAPLMAATTTTTINSKLGNNYILLNQVTDLGVTTTVNSTDNRFNAPYDVHCYRATLFVHNSGYTKHIYVVAKNASNQWVRTAAHYVRTLSDGSELWQAEGTFDGDAKFELCYQEINAWDNNNGSDYSFYDLIGK